MSIAKLKMWSNILADKWLRGYEPALVVGWADVAILLLFTMLIFAVLGHVVDHAWLYTANAPANFYTAEDKNAINALYDIFRFVPVVAFGIVIIYIINYSNTKKGQ